MKVLLIPDKFKGSISAKGVVAAITKGIEKVDSKVETISIMASDGGDGFLNAVAENIDHQRITDSTIDPIGRAIEAEYLISKDERKAYIELAKASGLELLENKELDVMHASTLGTGSQVSQVISRGAKEIYIGLGGSATNDAAIGIAHALGYVFFDVNGKRLQPISRNLSQIDKIELPENMKQLNAVSFFAVNDVDNPLFGSNGAAYTYARQKGASEEQVEELDRGLRNLSEVVKQQLRKDYATLAGAGAAGGTAYGLKIFLNATFISGINFILGLSGVENLLKEEKFDYIITGEGKFDDQTLHGKLIKGVVDLGNRFNVPVIVVCGKVDVEQNELGKLGLAAVLEIADNTKPLQYNMEHASDLIENRISEFFTKKI